MGISNKLGVFFVGVNLLLPALAHALIIEPIKIDSSQGEPLYAEIPFHNANNQNPIQVSIAQPFELGVPEAIDPNKLSHFNFYVRQNNQGNGVIVITSSRPIHDSNLNLVLKINDSGQVHMQQVRNKLPSRIERLQSNLHETPLQPRIVTDEQALALNLPTVSNLPKNEQILAVQNTAPPLLNNTAKNTPTINVTTTTTTPTQNSTTLNTIGLQSQTLTLSQPEVTTTAPVMQTTTIQTPQPNITPTQISLAPPVNTQIAPVTQVPTAPTTTPPIERTTGNTTQQHQVKANDSLWAIANQIAKSQNVSTQQVMKDIQINNKHAFVNGNANRLRQGVVLNIPNEYRMPATAKATEQKAIPAVTTRTPPRPAPTTTPAKQTQAHMSIVANDSQGAIQGTNKAGQTNSTQQHELTVQLKQERIATLTLQNNVRQLDQQLKQKETRIALLNARLAELEQQLKSRQAEQQSDDTSKTSSRSQSIVPALIAGTLVAFAGLHSDVAIATLLQELI